MGKQTIIYENGQVYEIDSDQIYVPTFEDGERKSDTGSNNGQA